VVARRKDGSPVALEELRAAGAGFVTAVAGDMQLMPGLSADPAAESIDVGPDGRIVGLR
jgi:formate--tetrahydrofolate ligase